MSFLLDTNVVSEWVKMRPDVGVVRWLADVDEDRVFISVITLAELRYGVERMPEGARRTRLDGWLRDELPPRFEGRILAVNEQISQVWGLLIAKRDEIGRPISIMDAFIAATAQTYDLTLVTRNENDFKSSVKNVLNPWNGKNA